MNKKIVFFASALIAGHLTVEAMGMAFEPIKLVVWRRGESIAGEDFIAANETVADYLGTLKRPTDPLKGIKYNCQAKGQYIRPSVRQTGAGATTYAYIDLRTVYALKDCAEIAPTN